MRHLPGVMPPAELCPAKETATSVCIVDLIDLKRAPIALVGTMLPRLG